MSTSPCIGRKGEGAMERGWKDIERDAELVPMTDFRDAGHPVEFDLAFGTVAKSFAVCFFATVLLAGIATFVATDFSPKTDKIIAFYGFVNPCLLFDHYPAKALAMVGMGCFILIGLLFSFLFFVYVYLDRRLGTAVWTGLVTSLVTVAHLFFVNVFTVNLYPEKLVPRRLHQLHAESSMQERDVANVELHTAFYIVWIMAEIVLMLHMAQKFFGSRQGWKMWLFLVVSVFGAGFHALAMLVMVLQDRPKVDWYSLVDGPSPVSPLQMFILRIDANFYTSVWGWVPIMFYRYLFSTGHGVRFTLSLEKTAGGFGSVDTDVLFFRSMAVFVAILGVGGVFTPLWSDDSTTVFKLAAPFRSKPFGYIAAPFYLSGVGILGSALVLTVTKHRLVDGKLSWPLVWISKVFGFSAFACILVVLEEERFTRYFFATACLSGYAWVLLLMRLRGRSLHGVAYVSSGVMLMISALIFDWWPLYYLYLVFLLCVRLIVVDPTKMHLRLVKIQVVEHDCPSVKVQPASGDLSGVVADSHGPIH